MGEVEGGEGEQARESLVLHLLHSIALQAESGQAGEGGEGVAGQPTDGVEGEVKGAKVGGEEVEGGRGEGAREEVAREVERGEVGEVLQVVLVDRPCAQLVGSQLGGGQVILFVGLLLTCKVRRCGTAWNTPAASTVIWLPCWRDKFGS